jgi:hypothetical protein
MEGLRIITLKIKIKFSYNLIDLIYGGAFLMKMMRLGDL